MKTRVPGSCGALLILVTACATGPTGADAWDPAEIHLLRSLWLASLEPLPPDPTNRWADDPRAAALGHRLFFEPRLSANSRVSCASCHRPDAQFQDGTALAEGIGTTDRRTMPVAATAYSPWQFWDGRKDSQWAQALGPLENPVEHGGTRALHVHVVAAHHREAYEDVFGPLPDLEGVPEHAGPVADPVARGAWTGLDEERREAVTRAFVHVGKAIAAYERQIQYGASRFDHFVAELARSGRLPVDVLSSDEVAGLRLFIGKANCTQCHNGPLFTNNDFHNTGVEAVPGLPDDAGRAAGAPGVLADEFNCRSRYSDGPAGACAELDFMVAEGPALQRAFKTPSLRNVAERAPYMHAGQLATLTEVLAHYNLAPAAPAGRSELTPLGLSGGELAQLEAFLRTLSGPLAAPPAFLRAPESR